MTFVSTVALYDHVFDGPAREDTPLAQRPGPYAFHKWMCEQRMHWLSQCSDWTLSVVRPSQVYGPGEPHGLGVSRMIRGALHDRKIVLNNGGEDARDLIYVEDVAQAIAAVTLAGTSGVFNVSSGSAVKIREMASTIASYCDEPPAIEMQPVTREPSVLAYDSSRIQNEIGFRPATSMADGLRRCVLDEIASMEVAKAC